MAWRLRHCYVRVRLRAQSPSFVALCLLHTRYIPFCFLSCFLPVLVPFLTCFFLMSRNMCCVEGCDYVLAQALLCASGNFLLSQSRFMSFLILMCKYAPPAGSRLETGELGRQT